jgi:primase-polymerase (primpol)-like protein
MDHRILTSTFIEGTYSTEQLERLRHLSTVCGGWFGWERGNRKVPMGRNGRFADTSDAATEMTLDQALAGMAQHRWGGVGVSMRTAKAGLVGIDLDHVIDKASGGLVSELGCQALERFAGGYVEVSPSGTGLRIFALGVVPGGLSIKTRLNADPLDEQAIEIYPAGGKGRFLRVTGAVVI